MLEAKTGAAEMDLIAPATVYDWKWMLKTLLRYRLPILILPLVCVAAAVFYVQTRSPQYTAAATLSVTNLRLSSSDRDTFYAEALFDPTFIETQIQVIASTPIAYAVIADQGIAAEAADEVDGALRAFRAGLNVQRLGQSSLVQIAFTANDAQRAADVANAVVEAYVEKLLVDREETVEAASSWLRDRLRGVGAQAHVVSPATAPLDKSGMGGTTIVALAAIGGGFTGMVLSLVLGFLDRRIRESEQIIAAIAENCLGIVPRLKQKRPKGGGQSVPGSFSFDAAPSLLSEVDLNPSGAMGQSVRAAAIAPSRRQRIAVTSTFAGEGKTTIASNLALLAVRTGSRVLLVDANGYNSGLSRQLAPQAERGIFHFLASPEARLSDFVLRDSRTGLHLLPIGNDDAFGPEMLWSDRMSRLFEQAEAYDLIVFDMPPLIASGDLRAAASFVDSVLLVIAWNRVSDTQLHAALNLAGTVRARLRGAVLNLASLSALERWASPEASIIAQQRSLTRSGKPHRKV